MVLVSTGGFKKLEAFEVAKLFLAHGITSIELSGGAYSKNVWTDMKALAGCANFQVHNYFPPPKIPFVLNLGSLDANIASLSLEHIKNSIVGANLIGASTYSFHAGFLLDPQVTQLGRKIENKKLFDRDRVKEVFVDRVRGLSEFASGHRIKLMIENNVLSSKNAAEFKSNPLLMCDPKECDELLQLIPADVGLLVDVAHLKVSANSLGFSKEEFFGLCGPRISGYHLSDNDGTEDTNQEFDGDAWFWPFLSSQVDYISLEVYDTSISRLKNLSLLVKNKMNCN